MGGPLRGGARGRRPAADADVFLRRTALRRRRPGVTMPGSRGHAAGSRLPCTARIARRQPSGQGLAAVEPLGMPFERGLLELASSEFLHDTGRATEASPLLDAAHARFAALGAVPYAQRTRRVPGDEDH